MPTDDIEVLAQHGDATNHLKDGRPQDPAGRQGHRHTARVQESEATESAEILIVVAKDTQVAVLVRHGRADGF